MVPALMLPTALAGALLFSAPVLAAPPPTAAVSTAVNTVGVASAPVNAIAPRTALAPALTGARTAAPPSAAALARGQVLGARVSAALGRSGATSVGAAVDVDGLGPVLRRGASRALPPASTQKSFVVAAAMLALPADAKLVTRVVATVPPLDNATAPGRTGNLYLIAGGDPYLTRTGLRSLAASVRAAGVVHIAGDVVLDDSRYDARRGAAGWRPGWVPSQSGALSALAVDGNRWRRDAAFLADPALPAAVVFRDQLRAAGVLIEGSVRRGKAPTVTEFVANRPSAPLQSIAARILKDSDNFGAELLLKELGFSLRGDGSSRGGLTAVREVLGKRGVPVGIGADGSGLSALNRQSAAGSLALLRVVSASGVAGPFRAALPVACQDGTLRTRLCGTAAAGRLSAKTGTLPGVRALAGYTTTASGRPVRFVFQVAGARDGNRARLALDRAAVVLAGARE